MEMTTINPGDAELRLAGIDALSKALGVTNALRFMALMRQEPTDYVEVSRRLYESQTLNDIFVRGKANWRG